MLGTCWTLSNGFQPGARPATAPTQNGPGMFNNSGANEGGVLPEIQKNKATGGGPKVDMGKFE